MNRRTFLKSAVCLAACPSTLLAYNVPKLHWSSFHDNWGIKHHVVSKGSYSSMFYGMTDLQDCHNLCATLEMLHVVVMQLQYSKDDLHRIYNIHPDNTAERERAWINLKRIEVTQDEIHEIHKVMRALRGTHNCVIPEYNKSTKQVLGGWING